MKRIILLVLMFSLFLLCSCRDSTTEISALRADMSALMDEVAELRNENSELKETLTNVTSSLDEIMLKIESSDNHPVFPDDSNANLPESITNEQNTEIVSDYMPAIPTQPLTEQQPEKPAVSAVQSPIIQESAPIESAPVIETTSANKIYITATGTKYHYSSTCNKGTYFESTLEEALAKGLTPCKKCAGG